MQAKKYPELHARAVAMEHAAAPNLQNIKGLGRHWSWESLVKADRQQLKMFNEDEPMQCVCVGETTYE